MKVRSITAHAGRHISPSKYLTLGLRPGISITADLEDGDDPAAKVKELHILAESLIEDQCDELLVFALARQQQRNNKHKPKDGNGKKVEGKEVASA